MTPALALKEAPNKDDEPSDLRVTRFSLPDINDLGSWLITRLRPKYPHYQDSQLMAMMRARLDNNECLFLKTRHGAAMAEVVHESLSPGPAVKERFVLLKDEKYVDEGVQLYEEIKRWANGLGCKEISVREFSDVAKDKVEGVMGRLYVRESLIAKVGK